MIFSRNKVKSLLGVVLSAGLLISCSENNEPQVKGANNATFYVESITAPASFIAVGEPNAQGKYNKKLLSLEACLKDNAQTNSVSNLAFDVIASDVTLEKKSDYRGCIQWQELIEFDPDDEVKNVMMNRTILAREAHSGGEKVMFTVNPIKNEFQYIKNGSFTESVTANPVSLRIQQLLVNENESDKLSESDKAKLRIFHVMIDSRIQNKLTSRMSRQTEIETLNLESKGVDFYNLKLDQNLNIIFPYRYYTRFSISLVKQNLDGIAGELIKKGNFQFYLVVLKENADITKPTVEDVLGATSFEASPRGDAGLITVPIVLNFSNVTSITNRVNFLFTAVSTDNPSRFVDQNFEGFSNGLVANKDLAIKLVPNSASAQVLHDAFTNQISVLEKTKNSVIGSLSASGLERVANPYVKYSVKEATTLAPVVKYVDLKKVMENLGDSQSLTIDEKRAMCSAYYQGKITSESDISYQNCLLAPAQYLDATVSEVVESVESNVSSAPSVLDVETFNMTSSFEISSVQERGNGNAIDGELATKGKIAYGFPKLIAKISGWLTGLTPELEVSASLNGRAYVSNKKDNKQTDTNSGKIIKEKQLTSLPIVISMDAKVAKCVVISMKTPSPKSLSRYFCSDVRDVSRSEYYYLVDYTRVDKTNSVIDIYSGVVNPFHMLVRGKDTFASLKETLTNKATVTTFFLNKIDDKQLEDPSNYMTQVAPRILSARRNLISK